MALAFISADRDSPTSRMLALFLACLGASIALDVLWAGVVGVIAIAIGMANIYSLPVSTTHVLSSGVAGTMVANKSGLQLGTVRTILMAWVLTLPATIALSAALFWLGVKVFI